MERFVLLNIVEFIQKCQLSIVYPILNFEPDSILPEIH